MSIRRHAQAIALCLALVPGAAGAQDDDERGMRGVIHQHFLALLNPMGMEHGLSAALRGPIGDQDELLFMGAHLETGLVSYVSPVFAQHGGYVEISPLSFLVLRAELVHNVVWPIGMDAAGYYALSSYDDDVRPQALTADRGGNAQGWSARMSATLQGMVPLGPVNLLAQDELIAQYGRLGDASHYYDMKWDLVLAREDWVLINNAVLLLEVPIDPSLDVRFGAYDEVRYVPASGYLGHQVGALVMFSIERPIAEIEEITPFVRGGYYTDHVQRADEFTILGGVAVRYDLGAVQ